MARNGDAPRLAPAGREDERQADAIVDVVPGCAHSMCLFEHTCLVVQAEAELAAARADRLHRREMGRTLADALGLGDDEGQLLEVIAYSADLGARLAAGELLIGALERLADVRAA